MEIMLLIWITNVRHSLLFLIFFFTARAWFNFSVSITPIDQRIHYSHYSHYLRLFTPFKTTGYSGFLDTPLLAAWRRTVCQALNTSLEPNSWILCTAYLCHRKVSDWVLNKAADWRILIVQ